MEKGLQNTGNIIRVALVVSASNLGDSLLYVALPLMYPSFGLSIVHVGILLSANRLVRFVSNTFAGYVYGRKSLKRMLIVAIIAETLLGYNLVFPQIGGIPLSYYVFR